MPMELRTPKKNSNNFPQLAYGDAVDIDMAFEVGWLGVKELSAVLVDRH